MLLDQLINGLVLARRLVLLLIVGLNQEDLVLAETSLGSRLNRNIQRPRVSQESFDWMALGDGRKLVVQLAGGIAGIRRADDSAAPI